MCVQARLGSLHSKLCDYYSIFLTVCSGHLWSLLHSTLLEYCNNILTCMFRSPYALLHCKLSEYYNIFFTVCSGPHRVFNKVDSRNTTIIFCTVCSGHLGLFNKVDSRIITIIFCTVCSGPHRHFYKVESLEYWDNILYSGFTSPLALLHRKL